MAKQAALQFKVTVAGTDVSADFDQASVANEYDELDSTTFGNNGSHDTDAGLQKNSFAAGWMENWDAGGASAVINAVAGTKATVTVQRTDDTPSATNPEFSFTCLISKQQLIGGQVGQMMKQTQTWPITGPITPVTS